MSHSAHHVLSTNPCACGCGEFTRVAAENVPSRGQIKGQPMRYLKGHCASRRGRVLARKPASVPVLPPPRSVEAALYRSEKAAASHRISFRNAQLLAEAKAAYDALNAELERRQRGGRPRKPKLSTLPGLRVSSRGGRAK